MLLMKQQINKMPQWHMNITNLPVYYADYVCVIMETFIRAVFTLYIPTYYFAHFTAKGGQLNVLKL